MKPSILLFLAGAVLGGTAQAARTATTVTTADTLTAVAVNEAGKGPGGADQTGAALVLRVQVLLGRVHFSPGEIDAVYGTNLRQALAGYQRQRGLPASGVLDAASWEALNADDGPVLVSYTITEADVAGPFRPIPTKMADKARLAALGFASAAEALGEKFHASPALLHRLNPGQRLDQAGVTIVVPNVQDIEALPKVGKIMVDRSDGTLSAYDTAGVVIAQFPATTGSAHDRLPIGNWKVDSIARHPVFHYNPKLFWDAPAGDKAAAIPAGPNNPVGVIWIDLSKPHYGIHGTPEPGAIGKTASHGCIRLTNWDVTALSQAIGAGTDVILQD